MQLEKNQEIVPSTRVEALFHRGISRKTPPSLLSLERVLATLEATQEEPQVSLLIARVGYIFLFHRENNPGVPVAPQEKAASI